MTDTQNSTTPRNELIEIVTRDPQSSGGDITWATDLVDAHRTANFNEAIEAARGEYLIDDTGTSDDEAYNRGVSDTIAAIERRMKGEE